MHLDQLERYPDMEWQPRVSDDLRRMLKAKGADVLQHPEDCAAALEQHLSDRGSAKRLALILSLSNLGKQLAHAGEDNFGAIQINTAIVDAAHSTGLQVNVVRPLVLQLLSALGMNKAEQLCSAETKPKVLQRNQISVLMPFHQSDTMHKRISNMRKNEETEKDETELAKYQELLHILCNSGDARALFWRGNDYLEGRFGTEKNPHKAMEYLRQAHEAGQPNASRLLGNHAFEQRAYTRAYTYLSAPGAVPANSISRANMLQIWQQKHLNRWNLLFAGGLLLLYILFAAFFSEGLFSGKSVALAGWLLGLTACLCLAGGIVLNKRRACDNHRWPVAGIFLCWAVYTVILLAS